MERSKKSFTECAGDIRERDEETKPVEAPPECLVLPEEKVPDPGEKKAKKKEKTKENNRRQTSVDWRLRSGSVSSAGRWL